MSPLRDRDDETGRFTEEFPLDEFIEAVDELSTPTTSRVGKEVGCSYDLAYRRLRQLEEEGRVRKREVGSSFLWERTES